MISTRIPELNEEQREQLVRDLNSKTSENELAFWRQAIKNAKKIKQKNE